VFVAPGDDNDGYIYEMILTPTAFYYWGYLYATTNAYGFFTAAKTVGGTAQAISGLLGSAVHQSSAIGGFTVQGGRLFWAGSNPSLDAGPPNQIMTAPAGGGPPQTVDSTISSYNNVGMVSDGTHVYWNTYGANGSIRRVPVANPTPAAVQNVALQISYPDDGIAVDATHVYFMDGSNIWRVVKDGSAIAQRLTPRSGAVYLNKIFAVDADYIYGPANTGAIARVSKTP
jgi:hypothetical protein